MVSYNMISDASRFAYNLNNALGKYPNFSQEQPELYQQYQKLINYAKFLILVGLTDEEIFDLFKNNFLTIFEILEINPLFDLIDRIRGFLVGMPIHQWRNSFKKDLINKLLENEEKITSAPLKDPSGKEMTPTIGNWLKDYQAVFGPTAHVDKVKQIEYLTNSRNTKNLSTEEKDRLRYLVNLYEFLKLNSTTLDGLEEAVAFETEDGKIKVLSSGRLEEVPVLVGAALPGADFGPVGVEEPKIRVGGLAGEEVGPVIEEPIIKEEKNEEKALEPEKEMPGEIPGKEVLEETKEPTGVKEEEKPAAVPPRGTMEGKEKKDLSADVKLEALVKAKTEVSIPKEMPSEDLGVEEIAKEVEKYKREASIQKPQTGLTLNQAIDEVIKSLELSFPDETAERRFKNILQSYLNGVRDQIDTLVVLKRPVKIGGMGFDESKAEEVIWLLKDIQAKLTKPFDQAQGRPEEIKKIEAKTALAEGLVRPEEMVHPNSSEVLRNPSELVEKEKLKPEFDKVKFEAGPLWRPKETTPPVKKEPVISSAEKEEMLRILEGRTETEAQPKLEKETVVPIRRPIGLEPGKRVLEDVKMKPRIYGPLEELKTIKLADWRSWGSPQESVNRIQDKIEFLAEESLIKKAQGIKSWQSSEVYRLYLEIGEEALEKQGPVEDIIRLREREKRPSLTVEEFNKISELNQKLRF